MAAFAVSAPVCAHVAGVVSSRRAGTSPIPGPIEDAFDACLPKPYTFSGLYRGPIPPPASVCAVEVERLV
jgi:hypothetical protein